jgi:PIN domain nuclease of toxin-antitoxin system
MHSIVIDTHALIWYMNEPSKLSPDATTAFNQATLAGDPIYVSTISIIEICYLVEKGKFVEDVLLRLLTEIKQPDSALVVVPPDVEIALALRTIPKASVPDMPDRIIAATALHLKLPLVSRDRKIQASIVKTIW